MKEVQEKRKKDVKKKVRKAGTEREHSDEHKGEPRPHLHVSVYFTLQREKPFLHKWKYVEGY